MSTSFGKALRAARRKQIFTCKQIAECCGLSSESVLFTYEHGTVTPLLDKALKLSKLLKFSLDDLDAGELKPLSQADPNKSQISRQRAIARLEKKLAEARALGNERVIE